MKQDKHNIFWVDAVKAICMIVVYFAHAEIYTDYTIMPINNVFRPFYVNAFFFVSGYLLFRKQWSESMLSQPVKAWLSPSGGGRFY